MFLSKDKKGVYQLYYINPTTSKRTKVTTKTNLKREAKEFAKAFLKNPDKTKLEHSNIYLSQFRNEINKYINNRLSQSSITLYNRSLQNLIEIIGDKPLKTVTIKNIEYFMNERLKKINKHSVNIEYRTLKAIFNCGLKWKLISENPLTHIKQFSIPQTTKKIFTQNEIEMILNNIKDTNIKNIVLFAIHTGCRSNEISNLQIKNVDLTKRTLQIVNKPDENLKDKFIFQTKSKRGRTIPISEKLYEIIIDILNIKTSGISLVIPLRNAEDYIFTNRLGNRYSIVEISKKFKREIKMLNLSEKFHFHNLRHYFITELIRKGVPINYVQKIVGHSDIQTTMNYIHIVTDDLREAVNKINII